MYCLNNLTLSDLRILYDSTSPKPIPAHSNIFESLIKSDTNPVAAGGSSLPPAPSSSSFSAGAFFKMNNDFYYIFYSEECD